MTDEVIVLAGTAAGIGFIHTILGPDHYVPFIVMSKARGWSARKTAIVTSLCGFGHVASSILLGIVGLFLGIMVFKLESIESFRGDLAGWLLVTFGFVYLLWGIRYAVRAGSPRTPAWSHPWSKLRRFSQSDALGSVHHLRARPL